MLYTVGMDYIVPAILMSNVIIPTGSRSRPFSISIIDDMTQESNETFNIAIQLLPNCLPQMLDSPSSSMVTIVDDDGMKNDVFYYIVIFVIAIFLYSGSDRIYFTKF